MLFRYTKSIRIAFFTLYVPIHMQQQIFAMSSSSSSPCLSNIDRIDLPESIYTSKSNKKIVQSLEFNSFSQSIFVLILEIAPPEQFFCDLWLSWETGIGRLVHDNSVAFLEKKRNYENCNSVCIVILCGNRYSRFITSAARTTLY